MTWEEFARAAVAVPFLEHGRDRDGWDCWGLICCGYRDVLGIEIPRYSGAYGSAQDHRRVACLFRDRDAAAWREVEREVGAIALASAGGGCRSMSGSRSASATSCIARSGSGR